ncbi:PLDc_N domain-containing protein [Nocardioides mangrovicus]|uniref:PLDc_N domain-containing protein n=1 Tax=Nocardioides mangrovicus TaxID=2478913 RepID=A0A3L8P273_9ACTN|nr:PLD nuclease N-terminal domain-containing protein [Nocardioides mangrovicus]RLV49510.1 PLDc_N domain-containing protein [Nocardioides mangrovicus]
MIRVEAFFGVVTLALWVYSLVDVIGADEGLIRHLPKSMWILIVLFFPLAGSIAWLVAGRPQTAPVPSAYERAAPAFPEYDRPGRAAAANPEDDEAFLRQVRERADEQRRRYREQQGGQGGQSGQGHPDEG